MFLGVDRTPLQAFSQVPGVCLRLSSTLFRKHLEREPELVALLQRYTQVLMMQISQGTACNRAHSIEQRCSRWLLMTHDRVNTREFALTQEFLGQMLGVRRATVNEVASKLQEGKLIRYTRGTVSVINRRGLETLSCACYWIVRTEYERILGRPRENGRRRSARA